MVSRDSLKLIKIFFNPSELFKSLNSDVECGRVVLGNFRCGGQGVNLNRCFS